MLILRKDKKSIDLIIGDRYCTYWNSLNIQQIYFSGDDIIHYSVIRMMFREKTYSSLRIILRIYRLYRSLCDFFYYLKIFMICFSYICHSSLHIEFLIIRFP